LKVKNAQNKRLSMPNFVSVRIKMYAKRKNLCLRLIFLFFGDFQLTFM